MFSKLINKLFKETTNIADISPVTFNSPGSYNPRYGKQHGSVSGKAQDGSYTAGFYYDNSYTTQDQVYNSPVFHPANDSTNITGGPTVALGGTVQLTTAAEVNNFTWYTEDTYNTNSAVVINAGSAYSPGNSSWTGYRHQLYYTPEAFNAGNTQNSPYNSPLGTNQGVYSAQIRPKYGSIYQTLYTSTPGTFGNSGYAYYSNYPNNGDYDYWNVFSTAVAGNWNAPNVYEQRRLTYANTYYSTYHTNAWTELGFWNGNYTSVYHPGTQGTNSPTTNTGSSYNAFGVSFPGGYGTTAPSISSTPISLPQYGSSSTNLTIPSGGYVTITFRI